MLYECPHCSEQFTNKESLELHKVSDCFEKEYPELVEFQGISNHLETTEEDPSWMCQYCPFSSQLKRQITMHEKKNHANLLKRKNKIKLKRTKRKIQDKENVEPIMKKSSKVENEIPEDQEPRLVTKKRKKRVFDHSCLLCEDILTSFEDYLNHYQKQHQVPIQEKDECSQCSKLFKLRSHQLEHVIGMHTDYCPFSCSECPRKFKHRPYSVFGRHTCWKENIKESESKIRIDEDKILIEPQEDHQEQTPDEELQRRIFCVLCKAKLQTRKEYLTHYNEIHQIRINQSMKCEICNWSSTIRFHHLNHVITNHTDYKPYKCMHCKKYFRRFLTGKVCRPCKRMKPVKTLGKVLTRSCLLCDKILEDTKQYVDHYNNEHQVPIQEGNMCMTCQKTFQCSSEQLYHVIAKHTEYRPYQCKKCKKAFNCRKTLHAHRCLMGQKAVKMDCLICSEEFERSDYFKHYTEKHYIPLSKNNICIHCGLKNNCMSALLVHLCSCHLDIDIFPCKKCGRKLKYSGFKHKCSRKKKIENFDCLMCSFKGKLDDKKDHYEKTHNLDISKGECPLCNLQLMKDPDSLIEHLLEVHATIKDEPLEIIEIEDDEPLIPVENHHENLQNGFQCSFCNLTFTDESDHSTHIRVFHGRKQGCKICNFKSSNSVEFENHFKEKHPKVTDISMYVM